MVFYQTRKIGIIAEPTSNMVSQFVLCSIRNTRNMKYYDLVPKYYSSFIILGSVQTVSLSSLEAFEIIMLVILQSTASINKTNVLSLFVMLFPR